MGKALQEIKRNEEGYLLEPADWTEEIAHEIAEEEGLKLTERHWEIIRYLHDQHKLKVEMSVRKVHKSGVVGVKEFYELFPGGPLKIASKIAGLPRPKSCV